MELIKVINNISERVVDDLKTILSKGFRVSIATASFSFYAFETLKEELENVDALRFVLTGSWSRQAAIATYWGIGRRIVEEEQHGDERAKYGTHLITELAEKLIPIFGNNYSKRNLQHYRKFYILFPDYSKVYEFVHNLNWTHIRRLFCFAQKPIKL